MHFQEKKDKILSELNSFLFAFFKKKNGKYNNNFN